MSEEYEEYLNRRFYGGWRTEEITTEKDSGCFIIRTLEYAGYESDLLGARMMFEVIDLHFFSSITKEETCIWSRDNYDTLEDARASKEHALADFLEGIGAREDDVRYGWSFFQEDRLFKLGRHQLNVFRMRHEVSPMEWANPPAPRLRGQRAEMPANGLMRPKQDDQAERTRAMVLHSGGYPLAVRNGGGSLAAMLLKKR